MQLKNKKIKEQVMYRANRSLPNNWECPRCNKKNFANDDKCRDCACFRSKARVAAAVTVTSDWACAACSFKNFASRSECKNCKAAKQEAGVIQSRVGDWKCTSCTFMNFASRSTCKQCNTRRFFTPPTVGVASVSVSVTATANKKPGDWTCGKCNFNNFGSRDVCFQCSCSRNKDQDEDKKPNCCAICMDKPLKILLKLCGHICMCGDCAKSVNECPMCRLPFGPNDLQEVFLCGAE